MARVVDISEAKAELPALIEQARRGERVIIGTAGEPVAVLTAYDADDPRRDLGGWAGRIWVSDDFDEPLPEETQRVLARSWLSGAIDEADPSPEDVATVLDGVGGAPERADLGRRQAAGGDTIPLGEL